MGAAPSDQLLVPSHLPVPSTQMLVRPAPMAVVARTLQTDIATTPAWIIDLMEGLSPLRQSRPVEPRRAIGNDGGCVTRRRFARAGRDDRGTNAGETLPDV